MHDATIARPVRVGSITRIGKELTADPTDTNGDYTAEMLCTSDVLRYIDPQDRFEPLRAPIRNAGIKAVARLSGVSRSQLQAHRESEGDTERRDDREDRGRPRTS